MFFWTHEKNEKEKSTINIPVSIAKCVNSGNGIPTGKLICNECEKSLTQTYVCDCGKSYRIGEIEKRFDEENEVIYPYSEKQSYLKSKAVNEIQVMGEIDLIDVVKNLEFVDSFNEIHSNQNEKTMAIINKIHKWLEKHGKALVVSYGHRGDNLCGVVVPSENKLLLVKFRDHRNIRPPKQQKLEPLPNESRETFEVLSEDKTPDLYETYIEKIKSGKKISIEKLEEKEIGLDVTSVDFLDE